jgi:transposase
MSKLKYIGLDVHQASVSVAVLDESGKLVMQSVMATRATAILEFLEGLRGTLHVTFEEGTYSAWLYDLLVRRVSKVVVCNPRKNALLKVGNKSDRIDALKLAELLRNGMLSAVYHGENSTRTLQELARSYMTLTVDTTRVMSRVKAIYRGQAIPYGGKKLYTRRHRSQWLKQLQQPGLLRRAERLYEELDLLQQLRRQAKQELMMESHKHPVCQRLRTIPYLGPIRAAVLAARVQTPHRFRSKRQFWAYCGLGLETRSSADYQQIEGQLKRSRKKVLIRGLNVDHNHDLKNVFKGAAMSASIFPGPLQEFYEERVAAGIKPAMAQLTLARKIAAIALTIWKKGDSFDRTKLKSTSSLSAEPEQPLRV